MVHRREAIHLLFSGFTIGLAGCSFGGVTGDGGTQSPSSPPTNYRFSLEASMINQASDTEPPHFTVVLTNESSQPVNVGYGQTLMFSAGKTEAPEELIIEPAADKADKQPDVPMGGCWKYPEDREVTIFAVENNESLANAESLSTTFAIYSASDTAACYPSGEYEFKSRVSLDHRQTPQLQLAVVISIDESGNIEVAANPPTETP